MKYTVQCWNGIGPNLKGKTLQIEAESDADAIAKALAETGMEKAKLKKPFAQQL